MLITNITGNYFLKQNDTATDIRLAVSEVDGTPVDLSLASRVEVVIGTLEGRMLVKTPKILPTIGTLEFGLDEGDRLPTGDRLLEIHIYDAKGEKRVAPSKGHYKLKVQQAIDELNAEVTTYTLDYFLGEVNRITYGLPDLIVRATELADQMDVIIVDSQTLVEDSTLALAQSQAAKTASESALATATPLIASAGTNATRAETAAIAAENATTASSSATASTLLAKDAATLATTQANEARDDANIAATRAEGVATDLEGYNVAISDFALGKNYLKNQSVRFNGSTYKAKVETQGNPLPVAPATSNTWFDLIAQRGVDGEGAVASVNGIMPDTNGDVVLPIPEPADPSWSAITGIPTTFTPSPHMHVIDDVTGLRDALNNAGTGTGGGGSIALIGAPERKVQHFTATANQTIFTLASSYEVGKNLVEVFVGGVPQFAGVNFTESSSTSITLATGVSAGTSVTAIYYTGFSTTGAIPNASATERGLTLLEDSVTSTSTTSAATPNSVRQVSESIVALETAINDKMLNKVDKDELAVNVKDFGAKCDGITDDTAAVQAAINFCLENTQASDPFSVSNIINAKMAKELVISGTCLITSPLYINRKVDRTSSDFRIVGSGQGSGFLVNGDFTLFTTSIVSAYQVSEFVTFEKILFRHDSSSNTAFTHDSRFLRIRFLMCEWFQIKCLNASDRYAQEWQFLFCRVRFIPSGTFFKSKGAYAIVSHGSKYQNNSSMIFDLADPTGDAGVVGCSFYSDTVESNGGSYLIASHVMGLSISGIYSEKNASPVFDFSKLASGGSNKGISISGCNFDPSTENSNDENSYDIIWGNGGGSSSGNSSTARLHDNSKCLDGTLLSSSDFAKLNLLRFNEVSKAFVDGLTSVDNDVYPSPYETQATAYQLRATYNFINVNNGVPAHSCKLPKAVIGRIIHLTNGTTGMFTLFPKEGDKFKGGSTDMDIAISPATSETYSTNTYVCFVNGEWAIL